MKFLLKLSVTIIMGLNLVLLAWFLKQEYRPGHVIRLADQFVTFLQNEDSISAFDMTLKTPILGKNLNEFQVYIERNFPVKKGEFESKKINYVRSGQTYGNRLRRWLAGRPLDVEQISVDYTIQRKQGLFLFEVRFQRTGRNVWKISYFQSHAG